VGAIALGDVVCEVGNVPEDGSEPQLTEVPRTPTRRAPRRFGRSFFGRGARRAARACPSDGPLGSRAGVCCARLVPASDAPPLLAHQKCTWLSTSPGCQLQQWGCA
jgi:hypothetical protein